MDKTLMRGWERHGREDKSKRSCSVCERPAVAPCTQHLMQCPRFLVTLTYLINLLILVAIFLQPLGSWTGWSGSSGPGSTMNSNWRSAKRSSWSRGSKRRGGVLLWRRTANRDYRRRKYVLMIKIPKNPSLVGMTHSYGFSNVNTEACFPHLRSDMNQQCVRRWRRAKRPNRTKTQEEGSSPRTVSRDGRVICFLSLYSLSSLL